ncbi:MAG: PQQ-binding-like beta-propeller repeat protein [Verrucomicrobiales bacterium]|nr:PQQ-binding-like beta-propeller repeat protein [Verrucomicrobiales bacterium]MCP5527609.1 PQQ-binding-like beta-propeller repeat protein [Verrucomicrobiales bacterium]
MKASGAVGDGVREVWRMAGGGAGRGGLFAGEFADVAAGTSPLQARGTVKAPVVFDLRGRCFVADFAGSLSAFLPDGQRAWEASLPGAVSAAPAVTADGAIVVVGTLTGSVLALTTEAGRKLWQRELPTKTDPRILSDLLAMPDDAGVVASSWGGRFWRLDARTGEPQASWDAGIYPQSGAAADRRGNLFLLRAVWEKGVEIVRVTASGEEQVWHCEPEGSRQARRMVVTASPVIDEAAAHLYAVFNRDRDAVLCGFDLRDGARLWRRELPAPVMATPGLPADGGVVVADLAGQVRAFDASGNPRWSYDAGTDYLLAGPVTGTRGGVAVWIGDPLGRVHRIDADGRGAVCFEGGRSCETRASFGPDGRLYVPTTDGLIAALSVV